MKNFHIQHATQHRSSKRVAPGLGLLGAALASIAVIALGASAPAQGKDISPAGGAANFSPVPAAASKQNGPRLSTPNLIDRAFAAGEISESERIQYLAQAIYEPKALPERFVSNVGWYGTQAVAEVKSFYAAKPDKTSAETRRLLNRPLAATVCDKEDGPDSFDSLNFRYNYTATDLVAGGLNIAAYAASMETTYITEVVRYGWAKPPLCTAAAVTAGGCNVVNPWDRYPIQIAELGSSLYGYVTSNTGDGSYAGPVGDNPNTPAVETSARASCMVLNNNFSLFPEGAQKALDGTTSHEYVHSIQNAYGDPSPFETAMWSESTAAYAEDDVFDDGNGYYQYLWTAPNVCLGNWPSSANNQQYQNLLFFRHVAEHNGGTHSVGGGEEVYQRFMENVAMGQRALTAYNNALVAKGTNSNNLPDAFHKYAISVAFSKQCGASSYAAPYCFREGAGYITKMGSVLAVSGTIASVPGSYAGAVQNHYAFNSVQLPIGSAYKVVITNTSAGGQMRASLTCDTGTALNVTAFPSIATAGVASTIANYDATSCARVVLSLTNQEQLEEAPATCADQSYQVAVSAPDENPTATPTPTNTPTATNTPEVVATGTPTSTPTPTATIENGVTPTATPTGTPTTYKAYLPVALKEEEPTAARP